MLIILLICIKTLDIGRIMWYINSIVNKEKEKNYGKNEKFYDGCPRNSLGFL